MGVNIVQRGVFDIDTDVGASGHLLTGLFDPARKRGNLALRGRNLLLTIFYLLIKRRHLHPSHAKRDS
jgi:hypothetical protein